MSSFLHVFQQGNSEIKLYLDLRSNVRLAQTCKYIQREMWQYSPERYFPAIDVAHFDVANLAAAENELAADPWLTAPARIPKVVSNSLCRVNFSTLKRINMTIPRVQQIPHDCQGPDYMQVIDSFVFFTQALRDARHLEEMYFDMSSVVDFERFVNYPSFRDHLAGCTKLKKLHVVNGRFLRDGQVVHGHSHCSVGFLSALSAALRGRHMTSLEELRIKLGA